MTRDEYLTWAGQISRREKTREYEDVLYLRATHELIQRTGWDGETAAWLGGITSWIANHQPQRLAENGELPMLYQWAALSPDLRGSNRVHINERRFQRWLELATAPGTEADFYNRTIEAMQVLREVPFDLRSLFDIAQALADRRAERAPLIGPESFGSTVAFGFHPFQRAGQDGKQPPYKPLHEVRPLPNDPLPGEPTTVLHMQPVTAAEKSAWVKAAQRSGMKVVPWARAQLNAAAGFRGDPND